MDITNAIDYDIMTDGCNNTLSSNCTVNENIIGIIVPTLLLTIPSGLSILCLLSLMIYTLIKPLLNIYSWRKNLYPNHPVRCIISGPSNVGKSVLLTNLLINITNEYDKIYIYSPSLHQDFYQKLIKCFTNYIPIHILPNTLNEKDIDIVIEERVKIREFEK